ncbi:hypothetical protein EBZ35_07820, partial [bacterium]|nr:hypothetical protein [bacterium]
MTQKMRPTAVTLPSGVSFASVYTSDRFSCALTSTGTAYCWGVNTTSQLGDGTTTSRSTATLVSGSLTFKSL